MRTWIVGPTLVLALLAAAPAHAADAGRLAQLPGTAGCLTPTGSGGTCGLSSPMNEPLSIAVSPDGRFVYVGVRMTDVVLVLSRDPASGTLTPASSAPLDGPTGVAVSPDGRQLYATSSVTESVTVFDRDAASGALTLRSCVSEDGSGGCADGRAMSGPFAVTVSPDGGSVYVAQSPNFGALINGVSVFDRAADGSLTEKSGNAACVTQSGTDGATGACQTGRILAGPTGLAVTADGASVYVAAGADDGVAILDRAPSGALSQKAGTAGCITETGTAGTCTPGNGLEAPSGIAASADGRNLYVKGSNVSGGLLAVLARDPTTGALSQSAAPDGCFAETGAPSCQGAVALDSRVLGTVLANPVTSPDGRNVYVPGDRGIAVFDRLADGRLSQPAGAEGCLVETPAGSTGACAAARLTQSLAGVALDPSGSSLYAVRPGQDAIVAFDRETAPVCADVQRTAFNATPRTIDLPCTDADGDQLTYAIVSGPAGGTLGQAAAGAVTYTPAAGFSGTDTFTYRASANGVDSGVATATVEVLPPGPPPTVEVRIQTVTKTVSVDRLFAVLVDAKLGVRRGRGFALAYLATAPGTTTLDVLRGKKRLVRVTSRARAGRNRIALKKGLAKRLKPGKYTLALTVSTAAGASVTVSGRVTVRRP